VSVGRGKGEVVVSMDHRSRVQVVRALLVVRSQGRVLIASRVRLVRRSGAVALLSDRGPCPGGCARL
jgi:hypothetical protein